jgi:hypothetical protein
MNLGFKILSLLAVLIIITGLYSIARTIIIKQKGTKIAATVTHVDRNCDRYNKIQVKFESKTYEVNISSKECRDRFYNPGQKVTLIKYKDYDELVWPESQIEWMPLLLVVLFGLVYFTNKENFSKSKK